MKAKGLWFERAGHRKGRLAGKQALKAKMKRPENAHQAGAGRGVPGNTLIAPRIAGRAQHGLGSRPPDSPRQKL